MRNNRLEKTNFVARTTTTFEEEKREVRAPENERDSG
jgi:hypothetical protein